MRKLLNTIYNFHWVARGEIARSAQAHFRGLSVMLASQKIRGLVNLRGHNPDYGWWRYETRIGRNYYWMIWYPIVYWMINTLTTVVAFPKALIKRRGVRAIWVSPDRGLR